MEFEEFYTQFERLAMRKAYNCTQDPHRARSIADDAMLRAYKYRGGAMRDIPLVVLSVRTIVSRTSVRRRFEDSLLIVDEIPESSESHDYELRIDIKTATRGKEKALLGGYSKQWRHQVKQRVLASLG